MSVYLSMAHDAIAMSTVRDVTALLDDNVFDGAVSVWWRRARKRLATQAGARGILRQS